MVFALRDGRQASFPLMHGDRDLLIETVANLVDNAVKLGRD
jgi:nitrogen-specific signal transduction histidine kinase